MGALFPYPLLTLVIFLIWLGLSGFTAGQAVLALLVAMIGNKFAALLKCDKIVIRRWRPLFALFAHLFIDIIRSHLKIAYFVLGNGQGKISGFLTLPIRLKQRPALAMLAIIMTMTPGTCWVFLNRRQQSLVIHVLDIGDEANIRRQVIDIYETYLLEVFGE